MNADFYQITNYKTEIISEIDHCIHNIETIPHGEDFKTHESVVYDDQSLEKTESNQPSSIVQELPITYNKKSYNNENTNTSNLDPFDRSVATESHTLASKTSRYSNLSYSIYDIFNKKSKVSIVYMEMSNISFLGNFFLF